MKYSDTLVSVILPVCNAEQYLATCLESLLRQTYTDIEIIAIDDDSRDDSYKILRRIAKDDKRLKVSRNIKRYGLGICLNRAMKRTRGRYITFMQATDVASLHRIKRQLSYLKQNAGVVAVGTQRVLLSDTNKRIGRSNFPLTHDEIYHSLVNGKTIHFESALIDRTLLPKDLLKFASHEYPLVFSEVFIKLTQYGKLANLSQHLYYRREVTPSRMRVKKAGIERTLTVAQFWMKSIAVHDYRPSVRALVQPLLTPVKTIFE